MGKGLGDGVKNTGAIGVGEPLLSNDNMGGSGGSTKGIGPLQGMGDKYCTPVASVVTMKGVNPVFIGIGVG